MLSHGSHDRCIAFQFDIFSGSHTKQSGLLPSNQTLKSFLRLPAVAHAGLVSKCGSERSREITGIMRNRRIDSIGVSFAQIAARRNIVRRRGGQAGRREQVPATAPQVQEVLPSYEGQNVVSVEIAGRPDLDQRAAHFTSDAARRATVFAGEN